MIGATQRQNTDEHTHHRYAQQRPLGESTPCSVAGKFAQGALFDCFDQHDIGQDKRHDRKQGGAQIPKCRGGIAHVEVFADGTLEHRKYRKHDEKEDEFDDGEADDTPKKWHSISPDILILRGPK